MAFLEVSVDAAKPLALLRNGGKRMAYACVNALNKTAKQVQSAERAHVTAQFTVRKPEFLGRQSAVIRGADGGSGFASVKQGKFEARIGIGEKERLLLSGFEEGVVRTPFKGKNVGVPVTGGAARPSIQSSVVNAYRFQNLKLRRQTSRGTSKRKYRSSATIKSHVTATGKVQWKGTNRTFMLTETGKAPKGGVYQRVGPGRDDIRMVYSFKPPMRLKRRLRFIETGRRVAEQSFAANLKREVDATLAFALTGVRL
jgi:hypothetical protein